jgi:hypothetical protein
LPLFNYWNDFRHRGHATGDHPDVLNSFFNVSSQAIISVQTIQETEVSMQLSIFSGNCRFKDSVEVILITDRSIIEVAQILFLRIHDIMIIISSFKILNKLMLRRLEVCIREVPFSNSA